MDNDKHVLVKEEVIGTEEMVDQLEESFLISCKHNDTTPEDLEYMRRYIWNLFAMLVKNSEQPEPKAEELKDDKHYNK